MDVQWPDADWWGAEQKCRENGAYLARILSSRDQDLMRYKLNGFRAGRDAGFYVGNTTTHCSSWPCGTPTPRLEP